MLREKKQGRRYNFKEISIAGKRAGAFERGKLSRIAPALFVLVFVLGVWAAGGVCRALDLSEPGENAREYGGGERTERAQEGLSAEKDGNAQPLPPLIQTTTLEEDYRAAARLGLARTSLLSGEDFSEAFENILCSCVCIQTAGYYGSGSIYRMGEDEIVIVSNRHLLQHWDEDSFVTFINGAAAPGEVIGLSGQADVGFVRVQTRHFSWQELLGFREIRPAGELETQETGILMVDMAGDPWHPAMIRGEMNADSFYLEDFGMEMLCGTGQALPGMSGSGVFDGYGRYLGMLTAGTLEGRIAAVPAQAIREEYERTGAEN